MNGYERVMHALRLEKADWAPIIPGLIQHNLEVAGGKKTGSIPAIRR